MFCPQLFESFAQSAELLGSTIQKAENVALYGQGFCPADFRFRNARRGVSRN
jgi:hypothetical protein